MHAGKEGHRGIILCCCQLLPVTNVPVWCPMWDFVLNPGLPVEGAGAASMVRHTLGVKRHTPQRSPEVQGALLQNIHSPLGPLQLERFWPPTRVLFANWTGPAPGLEESP